MTSEIGYGATGTVLRGTLFVEGCGDIAPLDIVMKISSGKDQKAALAHEHRIYRSLDKCGITKGIGKVLGLFRDACYPGDDALLMLYEGVPFDTANTGSLSYSERYGLAFPGLNLSDNCFFSPELLPWRHWRAFTLPEFFMGIFAQEMSSSVHTVLR
jgi:hypothetical protein